MSVAQIAHTCSAVRRCFAAAAVAGLAGCVLPEASRAADGGYADGGNGGAGGHGGTGASASTGAAGNGGGGAPEGPCGIANVVLEDAFADGYTDASLWDVVEDNGGTAEEQVPAAALVVATGLDPYAAGYYSSVAQVSFARSAACVRVTADVNDDGAVLTLRDDELDGVAAGLHDGELSLAIVVAGQVVNVDGQPYDSRNHRWWRMSSAPGATPIVRLEASANADTWTTVTELEAPAAMNIDAVTVLVGVIRTGDRGAMTAEFRSLQLGGLPR
jgi:hypothetical protein